MNVIWFQEIDYAPTVLAVVFGLVAAVEGGILFVVWWRTRGAVAANNRVVDARPLASRVAPAIAAIRPEVLSTLRRPPPPPPPPRRSRLATIASAPPPPQSGCRKDPNGDLLFGESSTYVWKKKNKNITDLLTWPQPEIA